MASCINKISRVEIIFLSQVEGTRADVSLGGEKQRWFFDEQGLVLRSGRGIAAISIIKPLINIPQVIARSNASLVDGLLFELASPVPTLTELRQLCKW